MSCCKPIPRKTRNELLEYYSYVSLPYLTYTMSNHLACNGVTMSFDVVGLFLNYSDYNNTQHF